MVFNGHLSLILCVGFENPQNSLGMFVTLVCSELRESLRATNIPGELTP